MNKLLHLTASVGGQTIYVDPEKIMWMFSRQKGDTLIQFLSGEESELAVKETPEDIARMMDVTVVERNSGV